jgi:hypothetical protein
VIPGLQDLLIIQRQYSLKNKNWTREHFIIFQWTHVQNEPRKSAADTFFFFFLFQIYKKGGSIVMSGTSSSPLSEM